MNFWIYTFTLICPFVDMTLTYFTIFFHKFHGFDKYEQGELNLLPRLYMKWTKLHPVGYAIIVVAVISIINLCLRWTDDWMAHYLLGAYTIIIWIHLHNIIYLTKSEKDIELMEMRKRVLEKNNKILEG